MKSILIFLYRARVFVNVCVGVCDICINHIRFRMGHILSTQRNRTRYVCTYERFNSIVHLTRVFVNTIFIDSCLFCMCTRVWLFLPPFGSTQQMHHTFSVFCVFFQLLSYLLAIVISIFHTIFLLKFETIILWTGILVSVVPGY